MVIGLLFVVGIFLSMVRERTGHILWAIGIHAGDLIAEATVAMTFKATAEDLASCVHAHPTLSEAVHEAALHVDKRAIHRGN